MKIENEGLGLSFELPEFTQRNVEAYFKTVRRIENGVRGIEDMETATALSHFLVSLKESKVQLDAGQLKAVASEFLTNLRFVHQKKYVLSEPELAGVYVRAGAELGWFENISPEDVGSLKPAKVNYLSKQLGLAISKSFEISPE